MSEIRKINQKIHEVSFYGTIIQVIEKDGKYFVAMKPLCEGIGLSWRGQHEIIKRDKVLNSVMHKIRTTGKMEFVLQNVYSSEIPNSRNFAARRSALSFSAFNSLSSFSTRCFSRW